MKYITLIFILLFELLFYIVCVCSIVGIIVMYALIEDENFELFELTKKFINKL